MSWFDVDNPSAPSEEQRAELLADADAACAEAAARIEEADLFILCTGAGFSADSGLAIYADVAKIQVYADRGLEYHDICQPHWQMSEPELFWGFWGQCYNDYRKTAPHEGYEIIEGWVERRFRHSPVAEEMRRMLAAQEGPSEHEWSLEPYQVEGHAGGFFVFTSNVDAHHFDWFRANEIHECHGNTEIYQCAKRCPGVWRCPIDFGFRVDPSTMLAPNGESADVEACEGPEGAQPPADPAAPPRIGRVRGGGRPNGLRYMPGAPAAETWPNHPRCKECGGPARPSILMFGDGMWQECDMQERRWDRWELAARDLSQTRQKAGQRLRVVMLEIGAGNNVTTVRSTAEQTALRLHKSGADVKLFRVNPELPLGDGQNLAPGGDLENLMVSIMGRGLDVLQKIQAAMPS